MAKIEMKNAAGKKAASIEVADAVFGITPNIPVLHQVVVAQLAHRRSGTQSTKTRSEVRGGGKKPFKQKAPVMLVRVRFARHISVVVASPSDQNPANIHNAHPRRWCNSRCDRRSQIE